MVSRRLDRDPSQSMHAQREGEFTSMMEIVLNDAPDNPLASKAACLSRTSILDNVIQISRREARERV